MCGIYLTNIPYEKNQVTEKLGRIKFRGPDYLGVVKVDELILGHLRLAILDLDPRSNQPFSYQKLHLVFNGEIYNYKEIRSELIALGYEFDTTSDTEVLLLAYHKWGSAMLPKLNGMFAFCIYDAEAKTVFCARDRLGVKPFYYYWKDGQFEICSQLSPMRDGKQISKTAAAIYLDCAYIPSPYSIFEDVYKLPPGNTLTIDLHTQKHEVKSFWDLKPVAVNNAISYEQAKEEVHTLLRDAVKIRLQADVPIGSFLSGGIDSALVSSIAASLLKEPLHTLSVGFEDVRFDESKIAEQYANILGAEHTTIICTPKDVMDLIPKLIEVYDEPFADSSALPSLLLNSKTKQFVTVALSGDGGDESFLGYYHFDWVLKFLHLNKVPYLFRKVISKLLILNLFGHRTAIFKNILKASKVNDFIQGVFLGFNSIVEDRDLNWFNNYEGALQHAEDPIQRTADLNIKLWLENDSNVKTDRASMAYAVEIRSPFLDYRVIEYARTLPVSFRYKEGIKKRILRDILAEYIPKNVFNQPKRGFSIPIAEWIKTDLRDEFIDTLSDENLAKVPNLNIKKFKRMLHLHLHHKHNYSSYIWRVYIFVKWLKNKNNKELFIDGESTHFNRPS